MNKGDKVTLGNILIEVGEVTRDSKGNLDGLFHGVVLIGGQHGDEEFDRGDKVHTYSHTVELYERVRVDIKLEPKVEMLDSIGCLPEKQSLKSKMIDLNELSLSLSPRRDNFETLRKHVDCFQELLTELNGSNLVLTGSCVLKVYGVELHIEPGDLDVAIYDPTPRQLQVINKYEDQNQADNKELKKEYRRVLKLISPEGVTIDIIVELGTDNEGDNYLKYKEFNLQPINKIMEARQRYLRSKDYESFLQLKNLNFNYK